MSGKPKKKSKKSKRSRTNDSEPPSDAIVPETKQEPNNNMDQETQQQPLVEEKDEFDQLQQLLEGDDFVSQETQQEQEARERRKRRRQRLAQVEQPEEKHVKPVKTETTFDNSSDSHSKAIKLESGSEAAISSRMDLIKHEPDQDTNHGDQQENDDDDDFDMFSSSVSPVAPNNGTEPASLNQNNNNNNSSNKMGTKTKRGHEQSDFDDAEGYYKAVIGETIEVQLAAHAEDARGTLNFKVAGLVGKGVFSTVLKCNTVSNTSSVPVPPVAAIKIVRFNDQMAKAAVQEIKFLQQLNGSRGVVPLLLPTTTNVMVEHRGHVLLVFPYLEYNLRDVLTKFGKGVGLSLQAVRSYSGQLLAALTHLKKHGIIHADIKPDNILVSGDFNTVQLADFGSAFEVTAPENIPTPYLVSRFYRAPEIILGLVPTIAVDLWSLAVTVAEIFLGGVLFRGKSNNDMLYVFMQHLGPFSNRVIRQHMVQCQKMPANVIPHQFQQEGTSYVFTQQTVDPVTGEPVHKKLNLIAHHSGTTSSGATKFPLATPLPQKLMKAKSPSDSRALVTHFSDLLQKCLALDPSRRLALKDALQHPFFQSTEKKTKT